MADNTTEKTHRELNLLNTYANHVRPRHLAQTQSLQRKISDHHGYNHHQSSVQSPPIITTTDYSDPTSISGMRVAQAFSTRRNSDTGYDTDGGIGTTPSTSKSHRQNNNAYGYLVSPRLPTKRSTLNTSPKPSTSTTSSSHHSPQYAHLSVNSAAGVGHHHSDKSDDSAEVDNSHRHHIRASRRIQHRSPANKNHGTSTLHASTISRHGTALTNTTSGRPFRLIFMRHSERANQALGSDWFSKAFRTNTYKSFDPNLPTVLPKRHSDQAYEFDAPITGLIAILY